MDGQDCDFLYSSRDLSAFELMIRMAQSKVEVKEILHGYNLTEAHFADSFHDLAKMVQDLPDGVSPAT
ncbi:hypothetical protein AB0C70_16510 [Streptomyces sp. NPDC048564]|uniref:hypothetical protein n=1 Tax=Streptomyces sp. NPDC048564 TaxID=3155760 RepID=UPI00342E6FEC